MCHHREPEYTRLYEDETAHESLPEWADEPEDTDAEEDEPEPFAPAEAD